MEDTTKVRAQAIQKSRIRKHGQLEIFSAEETHDGSHFLNLRDRYCAMAKNRVENHLRKDIRVKYDDAWATALRRPLVWESDLKDWIKEWQKIEQVHLDGLSNRERSPKRDRGHTIVWK